MVLVFRSYLFRDCSPLEKRPGFKINRPNQMKQLLSGILTPVAFQSKFLAQPLQSLGEAPTQSGESPHNGSSLEEAFKQLFQTVKEVYR